MGDVMGEQLSRKGLFHLFVVYTVWSTTYLAMRVGVHPDNGFPPFLFGALRMVVAAILLFGLARWQKQPLFSNRSDLTSLAIVGNLLWMGGNGMVLWAVQYAGSGFASLVVSSAPIWATLIELVCYRKKPSLLLLLSLFVGFAGVAVLSVPSLERGASRDMLAALALVLAALCWAAGSVLQSRRPVRLSAQVMSAYHQLFASGGFLLFSLLVGEPSPQPTTAAWLAWLYLVFFGSVFAFTSYILSLQLLPLNIAMTYAYVNPVLALFLGWLLLGEPIGVWTVLGAMLVLISVFGIFRVKLVPAAAK
jgi:drug/metabolite transporter (DMT)-like permease